MMSDYGPLWQWLESLFCLACRLYSSAHFNDTFPAHTPPEILNTSLEGLVLFMKAMHVDKVCTLPPIPICL